MRNRRALLAAGAGFGLGFAAASGRAQDVDEFNGRAMPYAAFDRLPAELIEADRHGAVIRLAFAPPGRPELPPATIVAWVRQSALAVATYYGRFPARETRLLIVTSDGERVKSGTAFAYRGAAIRLQLGAEVTLERLNADWILVREMTHLALPSVPPQQHWIEEGLATYVEPLARAQAGQLGLAPVWSSMLRGLPNGLPKAGDGGLDHTPTWGRIYWGGALFALLADIDIRQRTDHRLGLQHALRAILDHANMESDSPLPPLLAIGDRAVGVPALQELYERMKDQPYPVNLDALWLRLGVQLEADGGVRFDDSAPLAAVRRALTAPPTALPTTPPTTPPTAPPTTSQSGRRQSGG